MAFPPKIDVHSHAVPPGWAEKIKAAGKGPDPPPWDLQTHLQLMDQLNIAKTILSIPSPGCHLTAGDDTSARAMAREGNEFLASIKKTHPTRFGYWATLPLPDVDGTLAELAYAFDALDADGVTMLSNHHGAYIGDDARFEPVIAALDARHATVFVHPTVPCMACPPCGALIDARPVKRFSPAIFEFFFEEVRVLFSIFSSGYPQRYPNVRWIIPHGGGAFPPIVERWARFGTQIFGGQVEMSSAEFKATLKKQFYFDLAGFVLPDLLPGLLRYVDPSRLLYGSDFPYTPARTTVLLAGELDRDLGGVVPSEEDRAAVYGGNAEALLARTRDRTRGVQNGA